jgi:dipeptidyl aminopeptidase/acylaminoacyl peptidase
MESSKEGNKSVRLAQDLAAGGCNALRFDFSYVGESEGKVEDLTISGEVEDLAGAWAFVRQRVAGPIGIVGSSLGGTVSLLFAGEEPGVAAVATIAAVAVPGRRARALPAAERERWRREGFYEIYGSRLRYTFLEDVERLDVPSAIKRIRCPLLVAHGTEDDVVPFADAKTIAQCAGERCELATYAKADHRFSDPVLLDRLLRDIGGWMLRHLDGSVDATGGLVSHTG